MVIVLKAWQNLPYSWPWISRRSHFTKGFLTMVKLSARGKGQQMVGVSRSRPSQVHLGRFEVFLGRVEWTNTYSENHERNGYLVAADE